MHKQIFIVITQTGTMLSRILKRITGAEYNHASLSLSQDLTRMYSFGRRHPYNPFWGGFVIESPHAGTFRRFSDTTAIILAVEITEERYAALEATLEACHLRFRPIIMTSFAFILGVLPLAIASGAGSASQRAIGTGVMGGMVTATVLAVFFVPVFYVVVRKIFPGGHVAPHSTALSSPSTDSVAELLKDKS